MTSQGPPKIVQIHMRHPVCYKYEVIRNVPVRKRLEGHTDWQWFESWHNLAQTSASV